MQRRYRTGLVTAGRVLRLGRIVVSLAILAASALLFCWLNARVALAFGWVGRIQIMPLALSATFASLAVWFLVTLIFGRIYCSSVCPLGTLQDLVSRIPRINRARLMRHPYRFSEANNRLRYISLLTVCVCALGGLAAVPSLLDPYSAFRRICVELVSPVVELAGGKEVVIGSVFAFAIAVVTLLTVGFVAWRRGRLICNTVCPVGNALGLVSRRSLFHIDIDTDICTDCRACEYVCKAQCISLTDHVADLSRCVACFNCVDVCDEGAIRYTTRRKRLSIPMLQKVEPEIGAAANISSDTIKSSTNNATIS